MIKYLTAISLAALVFSCASHEGNSVAATADSADNSSGYGKDKSSVAGAYLKTDGDSLVIPPFKIDISLSAKANEKLLHDKETIIVAAFFSGQPKDTTSKEYAESGELALTYAQRELSNSRIASFDGVKFSKKQFDLLADKDISVLINVYSGRHSTGDNLLDCGILSDKMSVVKERKIVLTGKLIGESDSLQVK